MGWRAGPVDYHGRAGDRSAAFTVVELLVVVAIVGLLSAIASAQLVGTREKARIARAEADLATLAESFELLRQDTGYYPLRWLLPCCCLPLDSTNCKSFIHDPCMGILNNECPPYEMFSPNWGGPYVRNPAADPRDGAKKVLDPWGRPYIFDLNYAVFADRSWFGAIFSGGPNQSGMNVFDDDNIVRPLCPCGEMDCLW